MSQPVKLSNSLVVDARLTGEAMNRSIAGQVEFWARLGRSVERLLQGDRVLALSRDAAVRPLSECLEAPGTARGRNQLAEHLNSRPFPHFEPHPDRRDLLIRIDAEGKRTVGRFIKREFRPVKLKGKRG